MAVESYKDGLGNLLAGVQWDGVQATADLIKQWSAGRATLDKRGVMGVMTGHYRHNVGMGDWVCMDANRRIFPLTDGQMKASFTEIEPIARANR